MWIWAMMCALRCRSMRAPLWACGGAKCSLLKSREKFRQRECHKRKKQQQQDGQPMRPPRTVEQKERENTARRESRRETSLFASRIGGMSIEDAATTDDVVCQGQA